MRKGHGGCRIFRPEKISRFGNVKKPSCDGHKFDSKREMNRYLDLKLMLKCKLIKDLELQPRIDIVIGGVQVRYFPSARKMQYVADFRYFDIEKGETVIEDVKMQSGYRPEIYKFKRALVHTMGLIINEV